MQKADRNSSAGTAADSEQKVEGNNVCQHCRKPPVVGSQSQTPFKESVQIKTPPESFTAQSWLFREFMDKMQRNNVRSLLVYSEDSNGSPQLFEWCMPKSKKKAIDFILSS